jgi:hypothetical protein
MEKRMKVGDTFPVSIAGQTVDVVAVVREVGEGEVTLRVQGFDARMATRTQIAPPEATTPDVTHQVLGVEESSVAINNEPPAAAPKVEVPAAAPVEVAPAAEQATPAPAVEAAAPAPVPAVEEKPDASSTE